MKKIIAMLVAAVLCLSVMAIPAMADGGQVSLSSGTVARGNQVTLNISVSGGVEFAFLKLRISYDKSALKIVGCTSPLSGLSFTQGNPNNPTYTPVWSGPANVPADGVIASITFEALADAAKGSYTIGVSVEECYNQTFDDVALAGGSGTITVTIPACANHTWDEGVVTKPATCETTGVKTYTCKVCQETKTEELAALGHQWDDGKVTKPATCEEKGVKTYTCSVCQATRTEEIPSLGGHKWDSGTVTKEATCEEAGVRTYTCTVCQATRTEEIAPLGHKWDSGKVTTEPTCEEKGVKTYTCSVCKGTKTEDIAPKGHSYKWVVILEATCTDTGKRQQECAVCGKVGASETIPAAGHKWDAGKVTTEPTCEGKGVKTFTCTVCKDTKTEDIAPLGHTWGSWEAVTGEDAHSRQCTTCRKTEKEAHKWDSGRQTKPATCSADGEMTFTCETCKAIKTEPIPATGVHDYTDHYSFVDGEDVHYGYCACGAKGPAEKHQYTQEGDILVKPTTTKEGSQEKLCVCGAKTTVTLEKLKGGEYDNVPKTGDITGSVVLFVTVCLAGVGGAAYLIKRKLTY